MTMRQLSDPPAISFIFCVEANKRDILACQMVIQLTLLLLCSCLKRGLNGKIMNCGWACFDRGCVGLRLRLAGVMLVSC